MSTNARSTGALRACVREETVEPHPDAMLGLHRYTVGA